MSYSIKLVADKTGLSVHTIRAWERRYSALKPSRTETNRRVYSEADVAKLNLLRQAIEKGHNISLIANLNEQDLLQLLGKQPFSASIESPYEFLSKAETAISHLDGKALESLLIRASAFLGIDQFISSVAVPLLNYIDQAWTQKKINIRHEHFATAIIRTHLDNLRRRIQVENKSNKIIVTTPSNQLHELGALLVAIVAARQGWSVFYLGPNLPAKEIADSALVVNADAIALSVVYPENDNATHDHLLSLYKIIPKTIKIIVGGRAAESYSKTLKQISALTFDDLDSLKNYLTS